MNEELDRIATALETIADYLLVGLCSQHGLDNIEGWMQVLSEREETE